jgi:hypothetical protein
MAPFIGSKVDKDVVNNEAGIARNQAPNLDALTTLLGNIGLSTHNYLYKPLTLYKLFISSQYGIGVLQTPPLKPLTSSLGPCHAVLQYHMTWHY